MAEPKLIKPGVVKELERAQQRKKKGVLRGGYEKGGGSKAYRGMLKESYKSPGKKG